MSIARLYRSAVPESVRAPLATLRGQLSGPFRHLARRMTDPKYDRSVRHMSERLSRMKDAYGGQRCFVMGNGPSLNQMDLSLLSKEYVWAANRCYLLFDRISWRPTFFTAVDKRVVPDMATDLQKYIKELTKTRFFFPVVFRQNSVLRSAKNVFWYNERGWPDGEYTSFDIFSRDVSRWVSQVNTVTIASLQLAVYLGFNPIYLIGCDTNYTVPSTATVDERNRDWLTSTEDDDPNHFDPRYFGAGSKWHDPHVERMIQHYEHAKRVCDSLGVHVYNATMGGSLEVFPRADYRSLFQN